MRVERSVHTTTSIIMLPFAPAKPLPPNVYTSCAMNALKTDDELKCRWHERETYDTKNMDTPIPPRPAKTPAAGKIIMPSGIGVEVSAGGAKNLDETHRIRRPVY